MIGFFIGLFIGAVFGFLTCGFIVANSESEKEDKRNNKIDGLEATHGDEWNTEVEDIDE